MQKCDISDPGLRPQAFLDDGFPPMHLVTATDAVPDCQVLASAAKVVVLLYGLDVSNNEGALVGNCPNVW